MTRPASAAAAAGHKEKERSYVACNKDLTLHVDEDGCVVSRSRSPSVGKRSRNSSRSSRRESAKRTGDESSSLGAGADDYEGEDDHHRHQDEDALSSRRLALQLETDCISGGVDYSPTNRVSDNFVGTSQYRLLNTNAVPCTEQTSAIAVPVTSAASSRRSPSPCVYRSGVDTTPACKVAENFVGTNQYHLLNAADDNTTAAAAATTSISSRSHQRQQHRSGVDTTPVSKVSENLVSGGSRSAKCSASVNDLDLVSKKESNDSGSEVSDEGYKSLGLVSTPPANLHHTTVLLPFTGECLLLLASNFVVVDSPTRVLISFNSLYLFFFQLDVRTFLGKVV